MQIQTKKRIEQNDVNNSVFDFETNFIMCKCKNKTLIYIYQILAMGGMIGVKSVNYHLVMFRVLTLSEVVEL
jgi:hypothetical protein